MQFLTIPGRSYTIQGTADLKHWTTVQFLNISAGPDFPLLNSYQPSDVGTIQVGIPGLAGVTNYFFRAVVQ